MNEILNIDDLDKLKFTSITHAIHFKYDNVDYFYHECDEGGDRTVAIYKGRMKGKSECLKSEYGRVDNLIKYKNNRKVLSSIDKVNFVEKLFRKGLIDTKIDDIKQNCYAKKERIKEIEEEIRRLQQEKRILSN